MKSLIVALIITLASTPVQLHGGPTSQPVGVATTWPEAWVPSFQRAEKDLAGEILVLRERMNPKNPPVPAARNRESNSHKELVAARRARDQARLNEMLQGQAPPPELKKLTVGNLGRFGGSIPMPSVKQVMGENDCLLEIEIPDGFGQVGPPKFEGIVGGRAPGRQLFSKQLAWATEIDTSDFVDGHSTVKQSCWLVTGTKRYKTFMGGSNTVPLLVPVDEARWKRAYVAWRKAQTLKTAPG